MLSITQHTQYFNFKDQCSGPAEVVLSQNGRLDRTLWECKTGTIRGPAKASFFA